MQPEPYRIKVVEPIHLLSPKLREQRLAEADFNLFKLLAKDVYIDLLTDSGTGSQSDTQWAGIVRGDESYAGSRSYVRFEAAVKSIFGYPHVIAVHQGRAAEHVLFGSMLKPGMCVVANTHFDTTRANVEALEAVALDLPDPESEKTASSYPFKGDMDLVKLEEVLAREGEKVAVVILTITNNSKGGQPVSMANARGVHALCERFGKPLIFDAARFAENCYFIQQREAGYADKSLHEIARELFALGDGAVVSLKKDGLANMGGVVTLRSDELTEAVRNLEILYEGYITYGGMSGRDLEAAAAGLEEVLNGEYLGHRVGQVAYLGEKLEALGIPTVRPYGGHAVFVDAGKFLPHIPPAQFPGHALAVALYREGGIRAVEIGSLMFGTGEAQPASELVRLAIPRRVYTQSHLDYVVDVFGRIKARQARLKGFEIIYEAPYLRHFTARLRECNAKSEPVGA
jgi:tyrosine phenol-lyase